MTWAAWLIYLARMGLDVAVTGDLDSLVCLTANVGMPLKSAGSWVGREEGGFYSVLAGSLAREVFRKPSTR